MVQLACEVRMNEGLYLEFFLNVFKIVFSRCSSYAYSDGI